MMDAIKRRGRLARWLATAMLLGACVPASAAACADPPSHAVFAAWGDSGSYFPAPGGTFEEAGNPWTGGRLVADQDPWMLGGADHRQALAIPEGTSATSPWLCVSAVHPDFRVVARQPSSWASYLEVSLRFVDPLGTVRVVPVDAVPRTKSGWAVSPRLRLTRDLPMSTLGEIRAQLRLTARGGQWTVDDVFIDPFRK